MTRSVVGLLVSKNQGASVAALVMTVIKKGTQFSVTAKAMLDNVLTDICDDKGKIRKFTAVDDVLSALAKVNALASAVEISFSNADVLNPAEFTGNVINKNKSVLDSYVKRSATGGDAIDALNTDLTVGATTFSTTLIAEKNAQKAAIVELKTWLDAEIVRITELLAANSVT